MSTSFNMSFHFTRYLYEVEEVKLSLVMGLLNKKEYVLFWAYELFYSGYKYDLIALLWSIYYDFYAVLNPTFEKYLLTKLKINIDEKNLASVIQNFIIRPSTIDVFILRQLISNVDFEFDFDYPTDDLNKEYYDKTITQLLASEDYLQIAYFIFNMNDTFISSVFICVVNYFKQLEQMKSLDIKKEVELYEKMIKVHKNGVKMILLSRIIHYYSILKKIKQGKSLYVHIEPNEIIMYETIEADLTKQGNKDNQSNKDNQTKPKTPLLSVLPARKILPLACVYSTDEEDYLSLFHLKREKEDIIKAYRENWEYYASFSPIWTKRIQKHNGLIDYDNKKIIFEDEDEQELFYQYYGLEPDEQSKITQEKTIKHINQTKTWSLFYQEHKNRGVLDISEDYLNYLDKTDY